MCEEVPHTNVSQSHIFRIWKFVVFHSQEIFFRLFHFPARRSNSILCVSDKSGNCVHGGSACLASIVRVHRVEPFPASQGIICTSIRCSMFLLDVRASATWRSSRSDQQSELFINREQQALKPASSNCYIIIIHPQNTDPTYEIKPSSSDHYRIFSSFLRAMTHFK